MTALVDQQMTTKLLIIIDILIEVAGNESETIWNFFIDGLNIYKSSMIPRLHNLDSSCTLGHGASPHLEKISNLIGCTSISINNTREPLDPERHVIAPPGVS